MHLRDALAAVATEHPGLIGHFGGHAMAAGLSLAVERFESFGQAFDAEIRRRLTADDLQGRLLSDGELEPADFSLDTAKLLREAGPWGQGFPEPLFDGVDVYKRQRLISSPAIAVFSAGLCLRRQPDPASASRFSLSGMPP